jgi:hypothetical protein
MLPYLSNCGSLPAKPGDYLKAIIKVGKFVTDNGRKSSDGYILLTRYKI